MKYHAQFLVQYKGDKEPQELLGTDGVFILDGRKTMGGMCHDAMDQIFRLRRVQPNIVGFKIMQGPKFSESTEIHRWSLQRTSLHGK